MAGNDRVAILGGGLAGLAAGAALSRSTAADAVVFEKNDYPGGHAASHEAKGFVFDEGPHLSFTRNEKVRALFSRSVKGRFLEHPGTADNYFKGISLKHPAQFHLYPLPAELKKACLLDMIRAATEKQVPPENYRDWCYQKFGQHFSEVFVRTYTRKYWTHELEDLTADWVGPRIQAPTLDQVLDGALQDAEVNHNYITHFRYPREGGFGSFAKQLVRDNRDIRYGHRLEAVDLKRKSLRFANGKTEPYEFLVSSLPLPVLIEAMAGVPPDVQAAAKKLECTSHFLVNLGIKGKAPDTAYWIYYYDEEIPFSRVSFPSRLSPRNAPKGRWSLQAEIVHAQNRPIKDPKREIKRTITALKKVGLIRRESDVVYAGAQDIEWANVVFNADRKDAVARVHAFLAENDVYPCGRYGDWAYLWTDESILSGERAAAQVAARLDRNRRAS